MREYDAIIKEHFDLHDEYTRRTLFSINEADKELALQNLNSKLYNAIVDKVEDIDFSSIDRSKGDFTEIENYDTLMETLSTIKGIIENYNQDTKPADIISEAADNLIKRKDMFERAFKLNIELPVLMYDAIGLSIVSSISFLISTCIEYIKTPNDTFEIALDKVALSRTKENLLFENLSKFNAICANGQFDKTMEYVIGTNTKKFTGLGIYAGGLLAGAAIACIVVNIIPILRELIFFFYYTRTRISDYFEIQSELLQMNAYNLEYSGRNKDEIRVIKAKQLKVADKFKKVSNFFMVNNSSATNKAKNDIKQNAKKYKIDDVVPTKLDSSSEEKSPSALF